MIRISVIFMLFLLLPLVALSLESAPERSDKELRVDASTQMSSFSKPGKSPCRCKTVAGQGCSVSVSVGLPSAASGFDAACKSIFSALLEMALPGNSRPVPLPPPKV